MVLYWFQNDLRTHDMPLLQKALKKGPVIGLYTFDPNIFNVDTYGIQKKDTLPLRHIFDALMDLKKSLESLNIPLYILKSSIKDAVKIISNQNLIEAIYAMKLLEPSALKSYSDIKELGIPLVLESIHYLYEAKDIPFHIEDLPDIFTTFRKKIEEKPYISLNYDPLVRQSSRIDLNIESIHENDLGIHGISSHFKSGETHALNHLDTYFFKDSYAKTYKDTRNDMLLYEASTKFSPHLAIGTLSSNRIMKTLHSYERQVISNESTYWIYFELLWREYFHLVHIKYKDAVFKEHGINGHNTYKTNPSVLRAWMMGETGYPLIDANMKMLNQTGYMSNRGRQNVASFFIKVLNQDWRIGAAYFESKLIDYDVSSNTLNWLYLAGIGNDPRENRMFNFVTQGERYDPKCHFLDFYLPVLKQVPHHLKYKVFQLSEKERVAYHITSYPKPVITLARST